MTTTWTSQTHSPQQTEALGRLIGQFTQAGDLIALIGELGAGKTQITRGLASGAGADGDQVASPTFVIMHEYAGQDGKPPLFHIDAYRVSSLDELESIGWDPADGGGELRQQSILVVEWADRLGGTLGDDFLEISLEHLSDTARQITIRPHGAWQDRSQALFAALDHRLTPRLTSASTPSTAPQDTQPTCPICHKPIAMDEPMAPFCSKRCRTIDLGKWISGDYKTSRPIEEADIFQDD